MKETNGNEEFAEMSTSSPAVLKEITDKDPNMNSSTVSLSSVQQRSTRNARLQNQWQSQQKESAKLQDKLTVITAKYYNQQEQWEKEQQELFSPTRSPTKIPKWRPSTTSSEVFLTETPAYNENIQKKTDLITAKKSIVPSEEALSEELEASKARILLLEAQLEESDKRRKSQDVEMNDWKDLLKKRDIEHTSFLLQYEVEKKTWKDEMKEMQANHQHELETRDADLQNTRQNFFHQIAEKDDEKGRFLEQLKHLSATKAALTQELEVTQNQMKLKMEENQKQSEFIQELEDENQKLKINLTRKEELEVTKNETSQIEVAMEQDTLATRELELRVRQIEGRHAEEVEQWRTRVDDQRHQIESISLEMERKLEDANARFLELERKHDKEVKEWQLLIDADITKAVTDDNSFEDRNILKEDAENGMVIGAGRTTAELLSPIRKVKSMHLHHSNNGVDEKSNLSCDGSDSMNSDVASVPSESIGKIDEILEELGEMDLERATILREINGHDDNVHIERVQERSEAPSPKMNSSAMTEVSTNPDFGENAHEVEVKEEPPKPIESPQTDESEASSESEILDETLHLLNNLKNMVMSHGEGNEHETSVIERLEVLSELMQLQEQSNSEFSPAKTNTTETPSDHTMLSRASVDGKSFEMLTPQGKAHVTPLVPTEDATALIEPWSRLVEELKSRCEFLERDRDEVARITDQMLQRQRASHKAELEAAVASAERKANETIHKIQLEANREVTGFFQNVYFECEQEVFNYSIGGEQISESTLIRDH